MDNLSCFKYKRRCSIFKKDLETEESPSEACEGEKDIQHSCSGGNKKATLNTNNSKDESSKLDKKSPVISAFSHRSDMNKSSSDASKPAQDFEELCINGELKIDDTTLFEEDDTKFRLDTLKRVFKDAYSDEALLDVVKDTNGLEHAVSLLLDSPIMAKEEKSASKSGVETGLNGSKCSTSKPCKAKKRLMSDEASPVDLSGHDTPSKLRKVANNDDTLTAKNNYKEPNNNNNAVICDDDNLIEDDDLEELKCLFPGYEDQELLDVLESNNFCLDDAIAAMEAFSSPKKTLCDETNKKKKKQGNIDVVVIDDDGQHLALDKSVPSDTSANAIMIIDDEDQEYTYGVSGDEDLAMSSEEKAEVLSLLDSGELAELILVRGCSVAKAEKICKLRPFTNWNDLIKKFQKTSGLREELIWECSSFLNERRKMEDLMDECEIISKDLQGLFGVETSGTEDLSEEETSKSMLVTKEQYVTTEPSLVAPGFKLKPYQLTSLNWLIAIHKKDLNGILADEMGLGKTIQAIVFLAHLIEQGESGPHLIVVPASTCDNWKRELEQWCPSVQYLFYSGSQEERRNFRDEILYETDHDFQILLTTYNMAVSSPADRSFLKKLNFHYAVYDEGHMLKNMKAQRYQALLRIKPRRMLLLTGTPIQNNLLELMSLLTFVMPKMFAERVEGIKLLFGNSKVKLNDESAYQKEKVAQAKRIMEPFVMRRLKKDVLTHLPVKHEHIVKCELPSRQQKVYDDIFASCYKIMNSDKPEARAGIGLMVQLRKAANHSLLHRNFYDDEKLSEMARGYCKDPSHRDSKVNLVFEDMQVMSDFELSRLCLEERNLKNYELPHELIMDCGKLIYLDSVLPDMKKKGDRVLIFNQFTMTMDIAEVYLQTRNFKYLRLDGSTTVSERQGLIDRFNTEEDIFIFLLSTKAGGLGINLTSANVVILYDSDYNPHNDKQAEARCHRMGQTREVNVYRLLCKDTIEEAILKCANDKIRLHEDISGNQENSEKDDIQTLLKAVFGQY